MGVALLVIAAGCARAADSTWTNTSSGAFGDVGNWNNGVPGTGDKATYDAGASYIVTFDGRTNTQAIVVGGGQNITWDLGGTTYHLTGANNQGILFCTNAADSGTLTIENGTLSHSAHAYNNYTLGFYAPRGTVTITNGGRVTGMFNAANWIVTGPGSYLAPGGYGMGSKTGVVANGALFVTDLRFRRAPIRSLNRLVVDNAIATNAIPVWSGSLVITNGGRMTAFNDAYKPAYIIGPDGTRTTVQVGDGGDPAKTNILELFSARFGYTHLNPSVYKDGGAIMVGSNGILRIMGNSHPIKTVNYPIAADILPRDGDVVTLSGGRIEMASGARFAVGNVTNNTGQALLRGAGTMSIVSGGTTNWSLVNDGWIKPGDVGATPAIGTINMVKGDLFQTNDASATLFFEFDATDNDRICLSGGVAEVGGTVVFTNMPGFMPARGSGMTWDFIRASDIVYTAVDNMSDLMDTFGLVRDVDYRFGVVSTPDGKILRCRIMPPPGTLITIK